MPLFNQIIPKVYAGPTPAPEGVTFTDNVVDINAQLNTGGVNFFKFECLNELIVNGIKAAVILSSVAFFVYLIWSGIEWMTSGGDKNSVESARNRMIRAFTGFTILAISYAIWDLVLYFFGLSGDICNPLGTTPPTT
jgi:hypothetical protein